MADLREKLQALVEEWRERQNQHGYWETANFFPHQLYEYIADQLSALLAEGEPKEDKLPLGHGYDGPPDGGSCGLACGQPRSAHALLEKRRERG